ncbi:MAG: hypothetical protein IKB93_12885 [Clostridia bacterium]|nr:hypothetical protein [Clostridia bacterium]
MKRLLSLATLIGIIFALALPAGVLAADAVVGYEYNGTSDGWNTQTSDGLTYETTGISMNWKYKGQLLTYTGVSDWGDSYEVSMDVTGAYKQSTSAAIYLEAKDASNGYRLDIYRKENGAFPTVQLEERKGSTKSTLATADFTNAPETFKTHSNEWFVKITYDKDTMKVYMRPWSYSGDPVCVLTADGTNRTGSVGILNNADTSTFSNIKIVKKMDDTSYDYCWNGSTEGWTLNGATVADNIITVNNSSASLADLTWGNDIEIQCDPSSILYNTSSKFYVDFCGDDSFANYYRLELQGRNTSNSNTRIAVLRDMVNGATNAYINSDTSVAGNIFDEGTIKITCKDGVISAWWTMPSGTEYELFKDKSFDNKYTSGKIRFGCIGDATIKNIKINGDFTTSKGSSLCNGQAAATMKETTGVLKTVNFNGLVYEAASGATLSGKMNLNVPVRYAATSGSKDALVYAAYYDSNNDLISVDKFDVNVTADNTWKEAGEEVTLPDGTAKVRCFVWNTALVPGYNMSHTNCFVSSEEDIE